MITPAILRGNSNIETTMAEADFPTAVIYEVTAKVDIGVAAAWEEYMRNKHVGEVVATGCFDSAIMSNSSPGRYRVQYLAPSAEALACYHRDHAARLRADPLARFPDGVSFEREEWRVVWTV